MGVVLITRPEPGATETAARVAALGLQPQIAPLLSIEHVGRKMRLPSRVQATLLTSRNGVTGCPQDCYDHPAFAVGDATASLARQAGFKKVMTASGDAIALANLVTTTIMPQGGSLYLPTGSRQGFELANSLRVRGYRVVRHVVYKANAVLTLPTNAEINLRNHGVEVVMFFSSETARHFVRLVAAAGLSGVFHDVDAISISERASMALRQLTWRRIRVAAYPDHDSMVALLA